jgi:dienelactone hydrolase
MGGDEVGAVVGFYPLTSAFRDLPGMIGRINAPVLKMVGDADHFHDNCCTADNDHAIVTVAQAAGKPVELEIYPGAGHGFAVKGNPHYDAKVATDAWNQAAAFPRTHLGGLATANRFSAKLNRHLPGPSL